MEVAVVLGGFFFAFFAFFAKEKAAVVVGSSFAFRGEEHRGRVRSSDPDNYRFGLDLPVQETIVRGGIFRPR
jgi:hypothetical protein